MSALTRETLLQRALEDWNQRVGLKWGYIAKWNHANWENFVKIEATIFRPYSEIEGAGNSEPGPFKLMAAFFIFSQLTPPFDLARTDGEPNSPLAEVTWIPRIAMWSYPYAFVALEFAGKKLEVRAGFPTGHFYGDFIGYLRSLYKSFQDNPSGNSSHLLVLERVTLLAMILEGATYGCLAPDHLLNPFTEYARDCLARFNSMQQEDISVNDPDYL